MTVTRPGYAAAFNTYWNLGWHGLLPLPAGKKKPPPEGFTGHTGAVPSYPDVCTWAEERPDDNLGLRLPDVVAGIDVDNYDGKTGAETIAEAERRWGALPPTYRTTSRTDGVAGIRLFKIPAGTQFPGKLEFPELGIGDIEIIQRHHRYAVVWPSTHPEGRPYRWIAEIDDSVMDTPPAVDDLPDLPNPWLEALRVDPRTNNGTDLGAGGGYDVNAALTKGRPSTKVSWRLGEALADLAEGRNRHDTILGHAMALLRYGKDGEPGVTLALKTLCDMYVTTVGPDRPGGHAEARSEFNRMITNGNAARLLAEPSYTEWAEPGTSEGAPADDPGEEEPSLLALRARDGAWLDAQEFPPLEYAVDGIIPEGLGLLVGPPKKGKSFLVANVGLAVAAGGRALGALRTTQRPVLYLALEDGHRRLQNRFRRILDSQPIPAGITVIIKASPREALVVIVEFIEQHPGEKPLIILDTLGKVKPAKRPGDDAYQADYALGTTLKTIIDAVPGGTLLVVHHTRKAEALDFVDSVSGTQGIAGSVDFVMVLDRKRHSDDAVLSVTGRDVPEGEYALAADYGILWRLDGGSLTEARRKVAERRDKTALGDPQLELLGFVNGRAETTATDVAQKLKLTPKRAANALLELHDSGRIRRLRRGVYAALPPERQERQENAGQTVITFPSRPRERQENDD